MSSVVHHEGRVRRSDFILKDLDWLRGCANLCLEEIRPVEVLLLQKWRKKFAILSPHVRCLYSSSRHLKPTSLAKDLHQALKPKKIGTWDATDIAKRRVKHHPFRHCLSRFSTSDDDLQCALYRTLYSGRFQRKFCESWLEVGTIPYRTVGMISRAEAQRTAWSCVWDRSALQSSVRVSWNVITRNGLAWENNGISQTGVILFYTINPSGPSAERVSRLAPGAMLVPCILWFSFLVLCIVCLLHLVAARFARYYWGG